MKIKLLIAAITFPLLFIGCDMNALFDTGDTLKEYDGPPIVEFVPLLQEVSLSDEQATVLVQLIGEHRSSDLAVSFSVDESSTAQAGVHYNLVTPSPVTLSANSSAVNIVIELIGGSIESGTVELFLNLEGGDGVAASPNQSQSETRIQGG